MIDNNNKLIIIIIMYSDKDYQYIDINPKVALHLQQLLAMQLRKTRTKTAELDTKPWAQLLSKSKALLADFDVFQDTITIGRKSTNTLVINEQNVSSHHCTIYRKNDKICLKDFSSNGTYLGSYKIGQGNQVEIQHLAQIWILAVPRVQASKAIGFVFSLTDKVKQEQEKKQSEKELEKSANKEEKNSEKKELKSQKSEANNADKDLWKRKVEQLEDLQIQLKKKTQEEMQKMKLQKNKAEAAKNDLDKILKDQITCSLCLEIMHVPVAIHPCNHHFCGSCLTALVKSKQENCVECRKTITTAQRDANFNVLIQQYLKTHPDQKRAQEQIDSMDKSNIFTFDTSNYQELIFGKKVDPPASRAVVAPRAVRAPRGRARGRLARRGSDLSASSSDSDTGRRRCRECNVTRNGFQCAAGQVHVNCHACSKAIPNRSDPSLKQCCILCDQFYCNLYYPPCSTIAGVRLDTVDNYGHRARLTIDNFRGNAIEFNYFIEYVRNKRYSPSQLFEAIATKYLDTNLFRFLFDKKIMKVPPLRARQVPVTRQSAVCSNCWQDLWFQLVLRYRMEINSELSIEAKSRSACYYGINCSTMSHKLEHAKKLNHCEFQTKF